MTIASKEGTEVGNTKSESLFGNKAKNSHLSSGLISAKKAYIVFNIILVQKYY